MVGLVGGIGRKELVDKGRQNTPGTSTIVAVQVRGIHFKSQARLYHRPFLQIFLFSF